MDQLIDAQLRLRFEQHPGVAQALPALREAVAAGRTSPYSAVQALFALADS